MQLDLLQKDAPGKLSPPENFDPETSLAPMLFALPEVTKKPLKEEANDSAKSPGAFKTISEAATTLEVPQHVLRFWESKFTQIKPLKRSGGRRYYRPEDMEILTTIKHLLYKQGYTIKGAKKAFTQVMRAGKAKPQRVELGKPMTAAIPQPAHMLTKKQKKQLFGIREELLGLRDELKAHLA